MIEIGLIKAACFAPILGGFYCLCDWLDCRKLHWAQNFFMAFVVYAIAYSADVFVAGLAPVVACILGMVATRTVMVRNK